MNVLARIGLALITISFGVLIRMYFQKKTSINTNIIFTVIMVFGVITCIIAYWYQRISSIIFWLCLIWLIGLQVVVGKKNT